jgi:hypothetical protein
VEREAVALERLKLHVVIGRGRGDVLQARVVGPDVDLAAAFLDEFTRIRVGSHTNATHACCIPEGRIDGTLDRRGRRLSFAAAGHRSEVTVGGVLSEAWGVYRLLFKRSVLTAAVVYAPLALLRIAHHASSGSGAQLISLGIFVLDLAGPLIVQGALIEIVRDVHEGKPPRPIRVLMGRGRERLWPLLGASLIYAFGVGFGLILLVIPGLILAARWSLLAPLVVLEEQTLAEARHRSNTLVKGRTGIVLACIAVPYLVGGSLPLLAFLAQLSFATTILLTFIWSALSAPFNAHVLSVIYYRLADPARPVIDPRVRTWRSVWEDR